MRKSSWIILALLVVGFLAYRLQGVPSAPYPTATVAMGNQLQVLAHMSPPTGGEFWLLSRRSDGHYVISVWVQKKEVQQFVAAQPGLPGRVYATRGEIRLGGTLYQGVSMQIFADGRQGYLTLAPVSSPSASISSNIS